MANIAIQRIQKEFKEVVTSEEVIALGIRVEPEGDSNYKFRGEILGPPDTPYENGIFRAASMTLRTILLSIQSLLCSPEPNDPQEAVVAKQYLNNLESFRSTARYWSQYFAAAPGSFDVGLQKRVSQITDMGYSTETALIALSYSDWDVSSSIDRIISE